MQYWVINTLNFVFIPRLNKSFHSLWGYFACVLRHNISLLHLLNQKLPFPQGQLICYLLGSWSCCSPQAISFLLCSYLMKLIWNLLVDPDYICGLPGVLEQRAKVPILYLYPPVADQIFLCLLVQVCRWSKWIPIQKYYFLRGLIRPSQTLEGKERVFSSFFFHTLTMKRKKTTFFKMKWKS